MALGTFESDPKTGVTEKKVAKGMFSWSRNLKK